MKTSFVRLCRIPLTNSTVKLIDATEKWLIKYPRIFKLASVDEILDLINVVIGLKIVLF